MSASTNTGRMDWFHVDVGGRVFVRCDQPTSGPSLKAWIAAEIRYYKIVGTKALHAVMETDAELC